MRRSWGTADDGDTPGVPPRDVPAPCTDLGEAMLCLKPNGEIKIVPKDYAGGGRIFKWLMGQVQIAREKIHG